MTNMNAPAASPPVKYIAEIKDAQELTLVGAADRDYWQQHLHGQELYPVDREGRAEVTISSVRLRWLGFRFNELSIAITVCRDGSGTRHDGFFLAAAFNTSRLLTFCERNLFRTPYVHAQVEIELQPSCSMRLLDDNQTLLNAERHTAAPPVRSDDEVWEGAIFLPGRGPRELFNARLGGVTEVYPFNAGQDLMQLCPSAKHPIVQQLQESHFGGVEWRIRPHAHHARSKTYPRDPQH